MMNEESSAFEDALVEIDWPCGAPEPSLRCPITGRIVAVGYDPASGDFPDDYVEPRWAEIPTVLFHYVGEVDEFDYIRPDLQQRIDEKRAELEQSEDAETEDEDIEFLSDVEILESYLDYLGEAPLVFKLWTNGIANGPVSGYVCVGLDLFAPFEEFEEDEEEEADTEDD